MKNLLSIIIVATGGCCYGQNSDSTLLGNFKYPYELLDTSALYMVDTMDAYRMRQLLWQQNVETEMKNIIRFNQFLCV